MKKYRALLKDVFLFAASTFVPKAISFFLVPLYTSCLTTAEYGTVDLLSTTVSLLIPILTFDICDGVMRFTIENKSDARPLVIAVSYVFRSAFAVIVVLGLNFIFDFFTIDYYLTFFFILNYISVAFYGVLIAYIRAIEKVTLLAIISVTTSAVTIISNIILLLIFRIGILGYLISGVIGYVVVDIIMFVKIKGYRLLQNEKKLDRQLQCEMLNYSIPLVVANISWWINSSSDRYIVTALCGVKENGVYSIAYKIPTILQMLQSVFSQAWLLSVFREYKQENGAQYVSEVYEMYYSSMSIACACLILMDVPMARFLYAYDFFEAWRYVPFLLISVVFMSCGGFYESLLTLHKKSKLVAITTAFGALCNITLNILLIKTVGVMGAAIATVCGYLVTWITRIGPTMKEYPFKVKWAKQILLCALLIIQAATLVIYQNYYVCVSIVALIILMNGRILIRIVNTLKNK